MLFYSDIFPTCLSLLSLSVSLKTLSCNEIAIKVLLIAANKTPNTCQVHIHLADCSWGRLALNLAQKTITFWQCHHFYGCWFDIYYIAYYIQISHAYLFTLKLVFTANEICRKHVNMPVNANLKHEIYKISHQMTQNPLIPIPILF